MRQPECVAVSVLRAAAVVCILFCHLFEAYGAAGSGLFYVGVPMFFAISGFLYGKRTITNWRQWVLRRMMKLYLPYLLFIVPVLLLYFVFKPGEMPVSAACMYLFNLQGFSGSVVGLNHLWFVTAIMACYMLLPCLQRLQRQRTLALLLSWLFFLLLYIFFNGRFYWLPLYSIVYFSALSHLKTSWCAAMAVLCLQAFCPGLDEAVRYSLVRNLVGLLIVFSTLILYVKSGKNSLSRSVKWLSDISYPLYLVHNLLMVGPFSLSRATPYTCLNVSLMLACSLGLALLLQRVAYFAGKKF